jgi:hypothetical protein
MKSSRPVCVVDELAGAALAMGASNAPDAGARASGRMIRTGSGWAASVTGAASQQPRISSPRSGSRRGSSPQ